MGISEVKSPVNTRNTGSKLASKLPLSPGARSDPSRHDSTPEQGMAGTATLHSNEPAQMRSAPVDQEQMRSAPVDQEQMRGPKPPPSDAEGEQEMQALPPVQEEPTEPLVTSDSSQDIARADPKYLREFEQLMGMKIFSPVIPGASMGVIGPDE
jgi:hypothetical protein